MPTLSITRNYSDGNTLTEAMLDAVCDSVETFLNTTGIGSDNIQDAAITTAKINALAVTTAKIDNLAVTTGKIANANVTAEKLADAISASKTSTYTIGSTDSVVRCDSSGGTFTVTLPTAAGITGRRYMIIKTDSSFTPVTIDGDGAETINGSASTTLNTQYESVEVVSDGTNWLIVNRNIPSVTTEFTPHTFNGFGTPSAEDCYWSRHGDKMRIDFRVTAGTVAASQARLGLPSSSLAIGSFAAVNVVGKASRNTTAQNWNVLALATETYLTFGLESTTPNTQLNGNDILGNGQSFFGFAMVPISGWNG